MTRKHFIFFPLWLVLFEIATYLSTDAYLPALPSLIHDLSISIATGQLTLACWFLGSASLQLILGPLADHYGARFVLFLWAALFVLTCIICATTSNMPLFLCARFLQGSAVCAVFVAGYATVHEFFESKDALLILARMSSISVLAPAIGPALGALVVYFLDWRWIFGFLAIFASLSLGGLISTMPKLEKSPQAFSLNNVFKQYQRIVMNAAFMKQTLTLCFMFSVMIIWITVSPILILQDYHFAVLWFGVFQFLVFGSFILGNRMIKQLIDHHPKEKIIRIAMTVAGIGIIMLLALSFLWPKNFWAFVPGMMLLASACGMSFPIFNRLVIESSTEPMGQRVAVFSSAFSLAGALSSLLVSRLMIHSTLALGLTFLVFVGIAVGIQKKSTN